MKLCFVTCTGGRPELFALCRRWVERQTLRPDCWVVTTDTGESIDGLPSYAKFHHVPPTTRFSDLPVAGARRSLDYALAMVPPGHAVVVIEDDDWYGADYAKHMMEALARHPAAQIDRLPRFILPAKKWSMGHTASPDQSRVVPGIFACRPDMIPTFRASLETEPYGRFPIHFFQSTETVSIKGVGFGLPGRTGATTKHQPNHIKTLKANDDPDHKLFRAALGDEDAESYLCLLKA